MTKLETGGLPEIDQLRAWIGRKSEASEVLTSGLVSRFDATLSVFGDGQAEHEAAPRLIHFCLNGPDAPTSELGEDGHARRGGFLPPVPLPRRMWAGGKLVFHRDLRVGDEVRRSSEVTDVTMKEGRSGVLCFVTVQHRHSVDGDLAVDERQDLVYRQMDGGAAPATSDPHPAGDEVRAIELTTPLLFRYSALTFNSHKIHYDHPYATKVEGYPGLVVHGPLQATLLYQFAHRLGGSPPREFSFRSVGPLFDGDGLLLNADRNNGATLALWSSSSAGRLAMKAEAVW